MRVFLVSLASFAALTAATGLAYVQVSATATQAYSSDSVRVGHDNFVDGRLGWREGDG